MLTGLMLMFWFGPFSQCAPLLRRFIFKGPSGDVSVSERKYINSDAMQLDKNLFYFPKVHHKPVRTKYV